MKRMKSKLLAILMSLAMVFTMMPMMSQTVYADDPAPPAPGIALGPNVLSIGSNTSGAATVHMAGTKWRVIGYGASQQGGITQVASSADTMTLIAGDNMKTGVQFRADWQTEGAHNYGQNTNNEDSNLKTEIEKLTGTGTEKIFSNEEKAGIVPRDLEPEGYTSTRPYTNGIAGDKVEGALLWPLSTQEATYMNDNLREANDYWWLRSPGIVTTHAAVVFGVGRVDGNGLGVDVPSGVRPAFNFNLESVIFTSAAAGGKSSGDVGAGSLKSVEPNSSNEWKLTLKSGHDNFEVENVSTCDGKTVIIKYSGAVAKKGEYISAIITDKNDAVKYYGNLTEFADGDSAQGVAKVTIEDKMESTDKLYIFNEQLNGDKKTDYSSALSVITIPSPTGHTLSTEWSKDGDKHWHDCSVCGKRNDVAAHTWSTEWSEDGDKHWHECTACGVIGDEAAHDWREFVEFAWKGYTSAKAYYACKCDDDRVRRVTATITEKTTAPTCTEAGKTTYTATIPAENSPDGIEHLESVDAKATKAKGHTWDAGKVTKKATTTATGIKTHACTVCNATKTETIPKLAKKANPLTIKAKTATVKYTAVKKKAQVIGVTKVIAFTKKGQGKMTYTKASGNKKITINKTTGKVTVKKGLKKGTYKVKVKVKAAGNANYKASAVKTVIFKIKVK